MKAQLLFNKAHTLIEERGWQPDRASAPGLDLMGACIYAVVQKGYNSYVEAQLLVVCANRIIGWSITHNFFYNYESNIEANLILFNDDKERTYYDIEDILTNNLK